MWVADIVSVLAKRLAVITGPLCFAHTTAKLVSIGIGNALEAVRVFWTTASSKALRGAVHRLRNRTPRSSIPIITLTPKPAIPVGVLKTFKTVKSGTTITSLTPIRTSTITTRPPIPAHAAAITDSVPVLTGVNAMDIIWLISRTRCQV
jgi:hypothetical protein